MSEEQKKSWVEEKRDWKAEQIGKYARLEKGIVIEKDKMFSDPKLNTLTLEREKLDKLIASCRGIYTKNIEAAQQQQAGIKLELVEGWGIGDKTFECATGTATLRTTKSLNIHSKEKLVAFLELNKKLTDFIKSFEITKLRKIKDAGMLEDGIATWDEKKSVAIKLVEAEQ